MKGRVFLGLIIVLIGLVLLLNQAGIYDFRGLILDWWPMVLVIVGAYSLACSTAPPLGGLLLLLAGAWFQVGKLGFMPPNWNSLIIPVIIIIVGLYLMFSRRERKTSDHDRINHLALFSGINQHNESRNFKGGNITALFGGVELDLSDAEIAGGSAEMDITTAFGGVDLVVPRHWRVDVTGIPIFGGWGNKTKDTVKDADAPQLRIRCLVMFGGIDIKSK